ncbi:hypothetical protein CSUI_008822 [Cystoisospora suis]|uniref:Transmembrane protein n=1 Tax=Cystoisospora suis TaxID=483139 RepID=A0A2C6KL45_9APIC|nr:hypothetical protein CSUI_008822 [Cystoisospora suis]
MKMKRFFVAFCCIDRRSKERKKRQEETGEGVLLSSVFSAFIYFSLFFRLRKNLFALCVSSTFLKGEMKRVSFFPDVFSLFLSLDLYIRLSLSFTLSLCLCSFLSQSRKRSIDRDL